MLLHHCLQSVVLLVLVAQDEALFARSSSEHHRIRLHLQDDEHLIVPKHATIKIIHPEIPVHHHNKFYHHEPIVLNKYHRHPVLVSGKLTSEDEDELKILDAEKSEEEEIDLDELFRPVSLPGPTDEDFNSLLGPTKSFGDSKFDDVKPVKEEIVGDLKYDFRTKTHSI